MNLKKNCNIIEHPNAKTDVYFLHGFISRKEFQLIAALDLEKNPQLNIIGCDARGHGSRIGDGDKFDWKGTIDDYNELINSRSNDAIVIGHSMGATMALSLGSMNPKIKRVFAVSGLNGEDLLDEKHREQYRHLFRLTPTQKQEQSVVDSLPYKYEKCNSENKEKYYLIHTKKDTIVPFHQAEENMKDLCLPQENLLIVDDNALFNHEMAFYESKTQNFIRKKISEYLLLKNK